MTHLPNELGLRGFETVENLARDERLCLEDLLLPDFIKIESLKVRREGDEFDAIIETSNPEDDDSDRESATSTKRQTVAYFKRPGLNLPEFIAQPGGLLGDLMKYFGAGALNFELPEYQDFNRQFLITMFEPDLMRTLFTRDVVDAFQRNSEFTVKTEPDQIAVYRSGQAVPPAEQHRFYTSAREIVDAITKSAVAFPADAKPRGEQWIETIQALRGPLGRKMRKELVTTQQVNDFLVQSGPRAAPRTIRNFAYGLSRSNMIGGGGFFLIATMIVLVVLMIKSEGITPTMIVVALIGAVLFFFATFFSGRDWLRGRRLLRYGVCEQAQVVKVEALEISEENYDTGYSIFSAGRQHNVTFETGYGRLTIRVGGKPAKLARSFQERGDTTRVLVDTADTSKVLWIDGLAVDKYR